MQIANRVELDVRAQLRNKLEPFELIMDTVKKLGKEDVFVLHATFKPTPLLGVMKLKGYVNKVEKLEADHWVTTFVHKSRKHLLEAAPAAGSDDDQEPQQEDSEHGCGGDTAVEEDNEGEVTYTLDNRGLEPPQPMIRTLAQLEKMQASDMLVLLNDRVPVFLIEELKQLGCAYEVTELADGTARIIIRKP